jgi:1-acyl-sn-glycerol-3-phosphate acyltransferase
MVVQAVGRSLLLRDMGIFKREQRKWAKGLVVFWGCKLEVFGAENVDPAQSYVVMCNHLSWVDIVALFLGLPMIPGFVAKQELAKVPFLGAALRAGGHVLVDRQSSANAREALERAAGEVRGGKTVLIFPEGTRGKADVISKFKRMRACRFFLWPCAAHAVCFHAARFYFVPDALSFTSASRLPLKMCLQARRLR